MLANCRHTHCASIVFHSFVGEYPDRLAITSVQPLRNWIKFSSVQFSKFIYRVSITPCSFHNKNSVMELAKSECLSTCM